MDLKTRLTTWAVAAAAAVALLASVAAPAQALSPKKSAEQRAERSMKTYFRGAPFGLKRFDYINAWNCRPVGRRAYDCTVDLAGYTGIYEDFSPYFVCDGTVSVRDRRVSFANAFCMPN